MLQRRVAVPSSKRARNPQSRHMPRTLGSLEFGASLTESIEEVLASRGNMSASHHASASPTCRPTSSSSSNRRRSFTAGSFSERGSIGSEETQGTSFADEAQTCYNILIILRTDTQHLISLRNENLDVLENISGLSEDAASSRTALLACINESITAATRSITQLGPFLDRNRWPAFSRPTTPTSQRRSFPIFLRPRRKRSKSSSGSATRPFVAETEECPSSPEELFSWTLALAAQHTAVLVATERLATFLESGIANVSKEEVRRRDARSSWWEQGRGEFENVGLIQSLLGKPKRTFGQTTPDKSTVTTTNTTSADSQGENEEAPQNLTPIMENEDGRSETVISDSCTTSTLTSTPKGLTARSRHHPIPHLEQQSEDGFSVRRVCTDPLISSSQAALPSDGVRLSRMETFGSEKPSKPPFPFSASRQHPRIATSPLPTQESLHRAQSERLQKQLEPGRESCNTSGFFSEGNYLSAGGAQRHIQPTPPFTPDASPEKPNTTKTDLRLIPTPATITVSPPTSPDTAAEETVYTPYTPLDANNNNNNTSLFTQRALASATTTKNTFQPLIRELNQMMTISPAQGVENVAVKISPIEARSRVSIAPRIEGGAEQPVPSSSSNNKNNAGSMIVSPVDTESLDTPVTQAAALLGVSPIVATPEEGASLQDDDADGHMAWLVYLERKQKVCSSRWSLERAKTSGF